MENLSISTTSSTGDKVDDSVLITFAEEKSVFERAIIEAFKSKGWKQIYEKLSIALDEIKFIKSEIKKDQKNKKFLLNKNIIDKLSRIFERKYFNVNIMIAKIYESLLEGHNFQILSSDVNLLICFSNEVLNTLESIKGTIVSTRLDKKCTSFLNFLLQSHGINEEQSAIINELLQGFPTRNSSSHYINFDVTREKIIKLCSSNNHDEKIEGISLLMENFGSTSNLEEQFDLLVEKLPAIVKAVISGPNIDYKDAYFQLGNFICSMLFACRFKVDAYIPEYRIKPEELSRGFFFLLSGDELIDEKRREDVSFLHESVFELTTQKDILIKCENIFYICNLILNTLSIFESVFDLQFVCYIILKRIYFTFPNFISQIEDLLSATLVNLLQFKDPFEIENSEECRVFLNYLLQTGEESLKSKLRKRIENRNLKIQSESVDFSALEIENESLKLSDFNLRVGYPNTIEIEAGGTTSKYIEVVHPNSIVYIGFATQSNDISFRLLQYVQSDDVSSGPMDVAGEEENFREILKLDRIDSSLNPVKVVMFVNEPNTYKLVFDNSFSWFTSKTLRFRVSVLKPLTDIDITKRIDFDKLVKKKPQSSERNVEKLPHENKILMVKVDGVNKSFNLGKIFQSETEIQNNVTYITLPVILTKDRIRIFRTFTNEYGINNDECLEFSVEADESLSTVFEREVTRYLENVNEIEEKLIFLSVFTLEKEKSDSNVIPVTDDEYYKSVFSKLGFFPENLMGKYQRMRIFANSLSDSLLLYLLYQKVKQDVPFSNLIHIHFDKYKVSASLYLEGVLNDKISGLNYDVTKTLIENVDNVIDFINKIILIFGVFGLSVSYSDIDDKLFILFVEELEKKLANLETKITLESLDAEFLRSSLNGVHLFKLA